MPLTNTAIRNAKPRDKPYKLADEKGLFLLIQPNGSKYWRQKYRFNGKEKTMAHGVYPDVGLKDARERRDAARKLLANEIDPNENRKIQNAAKAERSTNSFEVVAREWYAKFSPNWAEHHGDRIIRRFERDIFPWIGGKAIADVTAPELLAVARRIESRGALETAHRALGNCGQVFRYAVATGRATRDPSGDLRGALPPTDGEHFAAVTEPAQVAELLRTIDGYQGTLPVSGVAAQHAQAVDRRRAVPGTTGRARCTDTYSGQQQGCAGRSLLLERAGLPLASGSCRAFRRRS